MSRPLVVLIAVLAAVLTFGVVVAVSDGGDRRTSGLDGTVAPPATTGPVEHVDADRGSTAESEGRPGPDPSSRPERGPDVESEREPAADLVVEPDCTVERMLRAGDEGDDVACLAAALASSGVPGPVAVSTAFVAEVDAAVRAFQASRGLVVDGIVGPQTAGELGIWSGPDVLPPDPATCPERERAVVVDRFNQRAWFCQDGRITRTIPVTTARSQPDPGDYRVYAKDRNASSTITGRYSTMTHFVAFTHGKYQGARIAFHSVPRYGDGSWVQPLETVGDPSWHGDSSGCIRVLPDDAVAIWNFLDLDARVRVVT